MFLLFSALLFVVQLALFFSFLSCFSALPIPKVFHQLFPDFANASLSF
jgi:hypothetical protein